MERRRTKASTRLAVVAGVLAGLVSAAGLTQEPGSGTWELLGPLLETRSGATATLLQSGQALVVGGRNRRRVLATAEAFDPASGSTPVASLHAARAYHAATRLVDGRVLVTGGASTNGITTATAELFDPASGAWTLLKMNAARAHHTATRLEDGRVLVAGGEADGVPTPLLEVFDPGDDSFLPLTGALATARTRHVAALLPTGVVFVAGGSDGTNALATSELIHPSVGRVMAGPAMGTARTNFTATDLLNGDVLIAGGTDGKQELASVERFNHETGVFELLLGGGLSGGRQGHLAIRLPDNNGVLVLGGTAAGQGLTSAELFLPDSARFQATESTHLGRVGAVLSATAGSPTVLVAGGEDTASAEWYRYATIKTDKEEYEPGAAVMMTGTGWIPGERVELSLSDSAHVRKHPSLTAVADKSGDIVNAEFLLDDHEVGGQVYLTARGAKSEAQNRFTIYARTVNSFTLNGATAVTVTTSASITAAVTVTLTAGSNWQSTGWRIGTAPPGTVTCVDHPNHTTNGTFVETFSITAPATDGVYNAYAVAYSNNACSSGATPPFTLPAGVTVNGPPTVTSIARAAASPTSASSVSWTVTFSETVTGVDASDFALASSGLGGTPAITGVSGAGATHTVTASTGTGSGTLGLNLVDNDSVVDVTSQPLGGPGTSGAGNGSFTGQVYTIDRTVPTVTSIALAASSPTNAASVSWTVTLSESVTGADATDFALVAAGLGGAPALTGISGSGTTYTVTASTGTGSGTLGLNLVDNDSVVDAVGNPLGGPGAGNGSFTGQVYTIDRTLPTVSGVTSPAADGTYNTGSVIPVHVIFSEVVTVTGTPRLTLELGVNVNVNYTSGSGTNTLTFTYTVASGHSSADLDYASTTALALNGGTIRDAVANNATLTLAAPGGAGSLGANKNVVVDTTGPTVTSVTSSTPNGTYTTGALISIQVIFSAPVTATGTPQLTLETGSINAVVSYTSGSGTTSLTFLYTVAAGHTANDLNYTNSGALSANGGTIKDAFNNDATLTLPTTGNPNSLGGNKDIVIDTTPATVSDVTSTIANATYGTGAVIPIRVRFSEAVAVTGTPQLTLETGASDAVVSYTSGSGTIDLIFTYTVAAGHVSADLEYASINALALNGGTIRDAAANNTTLTLPAIGGGNSLGGNKNLVIDAVAPTVTNVTSSTPNGTYGNGAVIFIDVIFSEPVSVTGPPPRLTLETGSSDAIVNYSSGTGTTTLRFNYVVASGHNTADLDYVSSSALALNGGTIGDAAGNNATLTLPSPGAAGSLGANKDLAIDTTAPTVASIVRAAASPTSAPSVSWDVTFSESVSGVGAADFLLVSSGLGGTPAISGVSGSGAVYTVTASTGTGTGTLGLNVVDDDSIIDVVGLSLGGLGAGNGNFTGAVYAIDRTLTPHVTAADKPYDGTTLATILTRTLSGSIFPGDDVTLAGGSATFDTSQVGSPKTVTATGLSLAGADAAKYVLTSTSATTTAAITARAITVTADAKTKTYGDADPALTYQITSGSLLSGDSFNGALLRAAGENVGVYAIQQGSLAPNSNYTLTFVGANLTIVGREVIVTAHNQIKALGAVDPILTYRVTIGAWSYDVTPSSPPAENDFVSGQLTRTAGETAGSYAIQQGTLAAGSNYTLTFLGATLTITPPPTALSH